MPNHPIFAPAFHGDVAKVRKLLKSDSSLVGVRDAKNLTPLHVAASRGQDRVAQLLLDYGADVHGPTAKNEWTPLVFAAYRGHYDVTKVLIDNGASITASGGNPIHFAGQRGHKDICRLLVEHGAVDDITRSKDEDVVNLFRAAYSYDANGVKEIISRRPKLANRKDKQGRTPMHEACTQGDTRTVRVLLEFGADATIQDKRGQSPMDRATAHRQHSVIKLLKKEADHRSEA